MTRPRRAGAAGLAVGTLIAVVVTAWRVRRETRPAQSGVGELLTLPGADLHVVDEGPRSAAALVMLHGATGSVRWWEHQSRALRGGCRVIRFDGLGNGCSEKPLDGYAIHEQAGLVAAALERLGVRRAVLVGYSAGGTVATELAALEPGLVRALILVGTSPGPSWFREGLLGRLSRTALIGELMRATLPDAPVMRGCARAFAPGFPVPRWVLDDVRSTTYSSYAKPRKAQLDYHCARPLRARLAAGSIPVLVLFGDEDRIVDPRATREWEAVPNVEVRIVEGTGHTPMVERPELVTELIADFLARRAGPDFGGARRPDRS
jgi:pimeloyl-ACP methyl ester carboxylesterase